jgi:hypothetical protein
VKHPELLTWVLRQRQLDRERLKRDVERFKRAQRGEVEEMKVTGRALLCALSRHS